MSRFPCPCCGHLTLDEGPGDYELCPVCFWEDDGGQLRYPMSPDGANGISLMGAQRAYARLGAMHHSFGRKVRRARVDEPLDEGWRPFDPERDWTEPVLDGDQWPANSEALYYWRATYWNGDQHRLSRPAAGATSEDRLIEHLRQVPEFDAAIAESERRWGVASAFDVCEHASRLAAEAYRAGDEEVGLAIVTALLPAIEEGSPTYAPNCVTIAFLENEAWHESWVQECVDRWPPRIRDDLRKQQAHRRDHVAAQTWGHEEWTDLFRSGRGQPVEVVLDRLRALAPHEYDDRRSELGCAVLARYISDPRWLYLHPLNAIGLAWRYRAVEHPLRTLGQLRRPRLSG
ncbi:hypothetical protein KVF89_28315 [Nocardioides carbamazepini]|uniref:CPCC family cysteine-rich protein n=1 Tax=Nocardioides carbamazepini TaxID=2854259 RepID=UPI00214A2D06|nr:CPCC family cysteine-rich protein [Nocardioides carbamazepini]MCR1786472.1 hypothetical protein [Nocardioides carbamazepini]